MYAELNGIKPKFASGDTIVTHQAIQLYPRVTLLLAFDQHFARESSPGVEVKSVFDKNVGQNFIIFTTADRERTVILLEDEFEEFYRSIKSRK